MEEAEAVGLGGSVHGSIGLDGRVHIPILKVQSVGIALRACYDHSVSGRAAMKKWLVRVFVLGSVAASAVFGQGASSAFPAAALAAKTIAIVNGTSHPQVEKGAADALQSWRQFKVVDDPEMADITLRFEKNRTHEGASTQKADANGKPTDWGYGMSFGSSIRMTASLKDADKPFYSTKTDESKTKAGLSCINDFHTAFRNARQQGKP